MAKEKVIIRRAAGYDPTEIQSRLKAGTKRKTGKCPPKHKDIVLGFLIWGRIYNPVFRMDLIYDSYVCHFFPGADDF